MAAVSVMRMRTGSYAHIIALINFGILNLNKTAHLMLQTQLLLPYDSTQAIGSFVVF